MAFQVISSLQNPRIKSLVRLRDAQHRRRQQRFLIEGLREVQRAVSTQWPLECLYFCPELFHADVAAFEIIQEIDERDVECIQLSEAAFRKVAYRNGPDGLLATAHTRNRDLPELPMGDNPLWLILEGIEKPGNLGAILRTGNAGGVDALVLTNPVADVFNPNAIRASQGAFFDQPFAVTDNETLQDFLLTHGFSVFVTSPDAQNLIWSQDLSGPTALVLGTEDCGLTPDWLDNIFSPVSIPMHGITDSLNVSAAAAVCIFEARRQRTRFPASDGSVRSTPPKKKG